METKSDWKELLALLNERRVDYLVVGAFALAFYGAPRYTGDLDLWVKPDPENARRLLAALKDFGFGELELAVEDFARPDQVIQLGVAPGRIDLLTSLTGVVWPEAFPHRVPGQIAGLPVSFLSRDHFLQNKRALGRNKDLADIEALGDL